jgi:cytochrome c oxidase subunit 1
MIAKQYLITGIIMGIIGVGMSLFFRMQLAWPEESLGFLTYYLVISGPNGVMTNDIYLSLVTTRYDNGFFVLTAALVVPLVIY